jgi:GT2 family glycosyltransferase
MTSPGADVPTLSVVIVTWNVESYIRDCIRSVFESAGSLVTEVIAVDNASQDKTTEIIQSEFPQVRLIRNNENKGLTVANNQGESLTRGHYVVFLNPDTIILEDALAVMIATMEKHPEIGVISPRMVDEKRRLSLDMGHRAPSALTLINSFLLLSRISQRLFPGVVRTRDVRGLEDCDWALGACLVVRREVVEKFKWREFGLGDDFDYCIQIKEAGWRVVVTGDATIIHYAGRSWTKAKPRTLGGVPSRFATYLRDHAGPVESAIGITGMRLGMRLRGLAHGAIYLLTRNPEELYKYNKVRQFLAHDEYSVFRKHKRLPPRSYPG